METLTQTLVGEAGTVTIARPALGGRAARRAPDHMQFIADHWPGLAAAAYAGFLRHGAGLVVLFGEAEGETFLSRWGLARRSEPFRAHRLFYATAVQAIPGVPRDWAGTWEALQLETYDPEREGLVALVEGKAAPCGYRVVGGLRPPEAHLRAQTMLN